MDALSQKFEDILWVARSLFERGKTAGSSANISFRHEDTVYITGSGACLGRLTQRDFVPVSMDGTARGSVRPSKELPLHLSLYRKGPAIQAVMHTHSFYATLWSCYEHPEPDNVIPSITPYLHMKLGRIVLVPFAPPGSQALFSLMEERAPLANGFLLKNHGPIVGGSSIMDAFYGLEELEEAAHIAVALRAASQE